MKIKTILIATSLILTGAIALRADVAATWAANCASCHGKDGSGSTMMGKKLGVKDLRDAKVQSDLTDETAAKDIKDGVTENGKQTMKAFKDKLSDDEIKALVGYIRTFKK